MQTDSDSRLRGQIIVLPGVVAVVLGMAGCGHPFLPSARLDAPTPRLAVAPHPVPRSPSRKTNSAAGSARETVEHAVVPQVAMPCEPPLMGYCGSDECGPILAFSCFDWLYCLGPLASGHVPEEVAEAELQPPHSRFHPVPTSPVFAARIEYEPARLMMEPVKKFGRQAPVAPESLPLPSDARPIRPVPEPTKPSAEPPMGSAPPPAPLAVPVPDVDPRGSPKPSASSATASRRVRSVLKIRR